MRLLALCVAGGLAGFGLSRWITLGTQKQTSEPPAPTAASSIASAAHGTPSPRPAQLSGTSRQKLADTLKGDDPFVASARVLAWVQKATIEDFRELVAEGGKFPVPYFSGFDEQFRTAYFDAIAERWFELDPGGALHGMKSIRDQLTKPDKPMLLSTMEADGLLKAAARVRPIEVLKDWPLENEADGLSPVLQNCFESLGASSPATARQYLDKVRNIESRKFAESLIAKGIARSDPVAVVAIGKQTNVPYIYSMALQAAERISPGAVRDAIAAIGDDLAALSNLPELLLRHPELAPAMEGVTQPVKLQGATEELQMTADQMSPEERQTLLDRFDSLPSSVRDSLGTALASAWARTEPDKAAVWAMSRATPAERVWTGNAAVQQVFLRWVNTTPEAAVQWWESLPPSPLRDAIGTNASTFLVEQGDLESAMALYHPQPGQEDELVTTHLAQMFTESDPARAAEWLRKIPDGMQMKDASRIIIEKWLQLDPVATAQWVESLPSGPRRDNATQEFVNQVAIESPTSAAEWVETISDRGLRQDAALRVFWRMQRSDPAAAFEWFSTLTGVDPA